MTTATDRRRVCLTPFEEYMLGDEYPGWPMTFWIRLEFSDPLDPARLNRAITATAKTHPLLAARIEYDQRRRPFWIPAPVTSVVHEFQSTELETEFPTSAPIDLQTEPGWRIWKDIRGGSGVVWMEFHHAVCDGISAFRVLEDILASYRDDTRSPESDSDLNWQQLTHRDRCDNLSGLTQRFSQWAWMIWRIAAYAATAPASLDVVSWPNEIPTGGMVPSQARIARLGDVTEYLHAAKRHGCTLNDLVITCLFRSLHEAMIERVPERRHRLRLFIPMDLRGNPLNTCQVGNIVGMLHIDRVVSARGLESDPVSVCSVASDMKLFRKTQMGRALVVSLGTVTALLGSPGWLLNPGKCGATTVLTNLKTPLQSSKLAGPDGRMQIGTTVLESVELFPPVRPMTPACFGLLTYGNELRLAMRFQPATFPAADAESLFNRFTEELRNIKDN